MQLNAEEARKQSIINKALLEQKTIERLKKELNDSIRIATELGEFETQGVIQPLVLL